MRSLAIPLFVLAACGPAEPLMPHVDRGPAPNAATDPLGAALHRDLVDHGGAMENYEAPRRGTLNADGTAEESIILPAGYCYAVFARVAESSGELTMRLVDSNGDPRQLDRERGPGAWIGMAEPLCPEPTTEYRLELRAARPGPYLIRLLRASSL